MGRSQVSLRTAEVTDALFLGELWADALRRADRQDHVADLEGIVKAAAESPEEEVLVAEVDGIPAGAVLLRVTTISPLNLDPCLQAVAPHVLPAYRRRGIGRALMEAAVAHAESLGIAHVATAALSSSRDANRFMARLALGPQAVLRTAQTHAVRAKIESQRPAPRAPERRARVLAARRSMRRSQAGRAAGEAG